MSGINEFMDKASVLAAKAAGKAKDLASVAAAKTKQVSRVAKLNMDISAQRETIRKAYAELGRLYYEAHGGDPEEALTQVCQEITLAKGTIASIEEEIARIKEDMPEEADFASVVDATAAEADVTVEVTVEASVEPSAEPEAPAEPEVPSVESETPPAEPEVPPVEPEAPSQD